MKTFLAASWWMLLLQGILLLLLGFFAVVWPGLTLYAFALGFAVYLLVTGVVNIILSLGSIGKASTWFLWLILSALEVGIGVYAIKHLSLTAGTLILLFGLVFVIRGIQQLVSAFADGYHDRHRAIYGLVGFLSLAAGVIIWLYPASGALAFSWVVGVYGLVAGALSITLAIEAKPVVNEVVLA